MKGSSIVLCSFSRCNPGALILKVMSSAPALLDRQRTVGYDIGSSPDLSCRRLSLHGLSLHPLIREQPLASDSVHDLS